MTIAQRTLAVTLTVEELEALVEKAVRKAIEADVPRGPSAPVTDDEMAEARKRWARKVGHRR